MDVIVPIRKALVPLVVAVLAVVLEAVSVDLPADQIQQVAAGLVTAVLVYLVPNR